MEKELTPEEKEKRLELIETFERMFGESPTEADLQALYTRQGMIQQELGQIIPFQV